MDGPIRPTGVRKARQMVSLKKPAACGNRAPREDEGGGKAGVFRLGFQLGLGLFLYSV